MCGMFVWNPDLKLACPLYTRFLYETIQGKISSRNVLKNKERKSKSIIFILFRGSQYKTKAVHFYILQYSALQGRGSNSTFLRWLACPLSLKIPNKGWESRQASLSACYMLGGQAARGRRSGHFGQKPLTGVQGLQTTFHLVHLSVQLSVHRLPAGETFSFVWPVCTAFF